MAFPGLRVLVVDDEASVTSLLKDALRFWGCEVEVGVNGEEGIEKYGQFRPDLVLMDFDMPIMNGFDASQRIMEMDPQAAILLITGFSETTLVQRAVEKGLVRVVIPKPFRLDQLAMAIQEAIKKPKPTSTTSSEEGGVA